MPFDSSGQWVPDGNDPGLASDFDEGMADVPVLGWLFGSSARRDQARNAAKQRLQERTWQSLLGSGPSSEQLTPYYEGERRTDEYGNLIGGPSQLENVGPAYDVQDSLAGLQRMGRGELAPGDVAQMRLATQEQQRLLRGQNDAITQQMAGRGMLGSGADLATRLQGSEAALGAQSQQQSQMLAAAQQRALGALQAGGQLGLQAGSQDLARRSALDAYNQQQLDWRRGRGQRSTEWGNRGREARSNAIQQAYQNRERGAAGLTGQYQQAQENRREDKGGDAIADTLSAILASYAGGGG
jgi:hypothetical protein